MVRSVAQIHNAWALDRGGVSPTLVLPLQVPPVLLLVLFIYY